LDVGGIRKEIGGEEVRWSMGSTKSRVSLGPSGKVDAVGSTARREGNDEAGTKGAIHRTRWSACCHAGFFLVDLSTISKLQETERPREA
jgi:hypothetical protein